MPSVCCKANHGCYFGKGFAIPEWQPFYIGKNSLELQGEKMKNNKKGFTLIEMLVVVLIIGILAGIALPQYQMAVMKAKVASMLPLMRRFKDALAEYKLQHGSYETEDGDRPDADTLGANWPSDWDCDDERNIACGNDYWYCFANEESTGYVYCEHTINDTNSFAIWMYQPDDELYPEYASMTTCGCLGTEGHKICKALGGKQLDDRNYQL